MMLIDTGTAADTLSNAEPETVPMVAVIVVVPVLGPPAVASPIEPVLLLMVATAVAEELHVAMFVTFWGPSVYVPVAVNCCVRPFAMVGDAGVTAMEFSTAPVTVRVVLPLTVPSVAVMVDVPWPGVLANPMEPAALLMETKAGTEEFQTTVVVRFWVDPSL